MSVVGERKSATMGTSYTKTEISPLCESFANIASNIARQNTQDIFGNPAATIMDAGAREALRRFYVEGSYDANDPNMDAKAIEEHVNMMNESFINECEAITENAVIGSFNPVIGMSIPMHKFILMNTIFDKGGIPKLVTKSPKWTETLQYPILVAPDGEKIDLFLHQDRIKETMDKTAPDKEFELTLPELRTTDLLDSDHLGHPTGNLSITTHISAVQVAVKKKKAGEAEDTWIPVNYEFTPTYGTNARVLQKTFSYTAYDEDDGSAIETYEDSIAANMEENKLMIMSAKQGTVIKKVKVTARIDTSDARQKTPSVTWTSKTDLFEIPEAKPINTTVAPELIKDVAALYNVNHLSVIMSLIKLLLENYKDDTIKQELDNSFATIEPWQKVYHKFDFAPRTNYALDHVEWRKKTFMDALDTYVTELTSVWRDPNVVVGIFGRPDLIRKVTPTEYTYHTPSSIGPINLDFSRTVCTSDNRVYNFMSSMKLNGTDQLIIVINPRNTDRFIYRIYDYQLYVSNEIRNAENPTLPAIHAFERFKFCQYQPVQGRLDILNPSGLRQADTDAWGFHSDNAGVIANNGYSTAASGSGD